MSVIDSTTPVNTTASTTSQASTQAVGPVSEDVTEPVANNEAATTTSGNINDNTSDDSEVAVADNSTQASISTRAQKLQKLAEEFFPGGPQTLSITPEFVQRLSDYELITQDQLNSLPASITASNSDDQDSISKLISNSEIILNKLELDPEFKGLFDSLKNAVGQMEQFQAGGSQSFTKSSKLLANELEALFKAMDDTGLTEQETTTIDQMILALNLTDSLNNGSGSSNTVINNYLA